MKIFFLLSVLVLSMGFFNGVRAQGLETQIQIHRPDLSGKWQLNMAKSRFPETRRPDRPEMSWIWIIEQKLPAISITMRAQRGAADDANYLGGKFTLFTDGRGDEFLEGTFARGRSFSQWKDNKLVQTFYERSGTDNVTSTWEFELAGDGQILNITMRFIEPIYDQKLRVKRIFDDTQTVYLVFDRIGP